jgi:hypothetical protein
VFPESAESLQVTRDKRCKSVAQEVKLQPLVKFIGESAQSKWAFPGARFCGLGQGVLRSSEAAVCAVRCRSLVGL